MAYIKYAYRHSIGNESYQNPDDEAISKMFFYLNRLTPLSCQRILLGPTQDKPTGQRRYAKWRLKTMMWK